MLADALHDFVHNFVLRDIFLVHLAERAGRPTACSVCQPYAQIALHRFTPHCVRPAIVAMTVCIPGAALSALPDRTECGTQPHAVTITHACTLGTQARPHSY